MEKILFPKFYIANVWHQQVVSELASKTSPLVTALLHAFVMLCPRALPARWK